MANEIKLQEGHPVDENLRPLKVGGKSTALETAQHGDGARITGGLEVSGTGKSIVAEPLLTNSIISGSIYGFQLRTVAGINVYSGIEKAITFDSGSDIGLDAGNGEIKFYDDGDYGEYFKIAVTGGSGATTLETLSDTANGGLTLAPDGELYLTPKTEVKSDVPLKIKEAANATTDTAAYGQLWTKNETPCELYFTTDAGDDIQITDGTSMAGGGGSGISTTLSDGNILVGNGSNVATSVNPSGDIDVTNAGVFSISSGAILDADVNASAAIAYSKLGTIPTWNQDTSGTAATVTGAAQSAITSLGTLTTLTVDDVIINGKVVQITGDTDDTFTITTGAHGATTLATEDDAADAGHLTLEVDGIIYFADADATYGLLAHTGSYTNFTLYENGGAGNDHFQIRVGANGVSEMYTVDAAGAAGHMALIPDGNLVVASAGHVEFDNCAVGFDRLEAVFSTTAIIESGGSDDTDIDFRLSNKYRLEMTADIAQMNLIFPNTSGNFLIVCTTNGDHDVTAWKVWEYDSAAGSTNAASTTDVMWAGGSVPAFTSSGVDIVSFYWDVDEQQAYGVTSLAFATP